MSSSQDKFLSSQYPNLASLQLYGETWNGQSHVNSSHAAPDPSWWTDNINTNIFSDEVIVNQVPQESPVAFAGVSREIPYAIEAGTSSIESVFQTPRQPLGFFEEQFGINAPVSPDIDLELKALSAFPDDTNCKVFPNPTSSSALPFNSDFCDKTSTGFMPLPNETICQKSQEKTKYQIPKLDPLECPHCCKLFLNKLRLRYVLLL